MRGGGKLILTGQPGQYDSLGKPQQQSKLEDLIGARVLGRLESEDNWVSLEGTAVTPEATLLGADLHGDWPFLVKGPSTVYQPTNAKAYGKLYKPYRTQRQLEGKMGTDWPMSADSPVGPAVLLHQLGKGKVVTCAASPDYATASEHALVEDRVLFLNLIRALAPRRRIVVDAPSNVEAVVTDDPHTRTLRVHLLAYNPTPRTTPPKNRPYVLPGMIEDKPIYRVTLWTGGIRSASTLNTTTTIKVVDDKVEATVEDVHEVILLEY